MLQTGDAQAQALDRAVIQRDVGDVDLGRFVRARRAHGEAVFWLVTSTRPVAWSSTGWLAPRWPNGSL